MNGTFPILICTGPTGGHFFPALSFATSFRDEHPDAEVHFVINRKPLFISRALAACHIALHCIPFSAPERTLSFRSFAVLLHYPRAYLETIWLLIYLRPRLVVGFGSYASVPGVLVASMMRIPILLHEQNLIPGAANRFLLWWADHIGVSFKETCAWFPTEKVTWTGFPVRRDFLDRSNHLSCADSGSGLRSTDDGRDQSGASFKLLVFGGSQGARCLNRVVLKALEAFPSEERSKFAVIHIVGTDNRTEIEAAYQRLKMTSSVFDFTDEISDRFFEADLVIARAGAGTIFELAASGRPAILVPYPYAGGHQEANANYLAKMGAAHVLPDRDLSPLALYNLIDQLRRNVDERIQMGQNACSLFRREANHLLIDQSWRMQCKST